MSNTLRDSTLADDQKVREYVAALHRYLNLRKQVPVEPTVLVNPITVAPPPGGRTGDDMSRFYVTLPSNSSIDCYPDNSVARFTTKLNGVIELKGDWEVGLTEISFPSDIQNVLDGHCYYTVHVEDRFFRKITLDAKH